MQAIYCILTVQEKNVEALFIGKPASCNMFHAEKLKNSIKWSHKDKNIPYNQKNLNIPSSAKRSDAHVHQ